MTTDLRKERAAHGIIYIIPFFLLVLNSAITLQHGHSHLSWAEAEIAFIRDPTTLIVLGSAYLIALILVLRKIRQTLQIVRSQLVYCLFLLYIALSMFWSAFPIKVFITWGHYAGYTLIAISSVYYYTNFPRKFFYHLGFLTGVSVAGSIIVSLLFPNWTMFDPNGRWYGITSNPNTLGLICLLSIWANIVSLYITESKIIFLSNICLIVLAILALVGSGSVTSIILSVFVLSCVPIFMRIHINHPATRILKLFFIVCGTALAFSVYLLIHPEGYNTSTIFHDLGRDSTFSGRLRLWQDGWNLFMDKPCLGWSFDALLSVVAKTKSNIGQFHNGYLHLIIRGGIVSMIFILFMIVDLFLCLRSFAHYQFKISIGFLIIVIAILAHNITEASIARSTHIFWFLFVFVYFYLKNFLYNQRKGFKKIENYKWGK
ncbi:MAG: O-antigen ligase family protein [Proteobacteria bacterium]|nr:O-antigen ligase family protein [Pseudomonadota bacterium]MBU4286597.1 O-antigen ligase family protein [Pseudomonadota bacterium]MBU4414227.1 O-antigen ligase family protein [Pseudomonadota bacterium]MCG2758013.1 O-antigen ligase family protein [Desulfobacteraceae bacterium]